MVGASTHEPVGTDAPLCHGPLIIYITVLQSVSVPKSQTKLGETTATMKENKLRLSPLRAGDVKHLFHWVNERDLVLHSAPFKPISEAQHRAWFRRIQRHDDASIFGIRLSNPDRLIGYCQLRAVDPVHRNAELQIRLGASDEWGKGYGTEAVAKLLRFAFLDRNLHRVYLHVFATNKAAMRLYEKAGFVREGLMRQAAFIDGEYLDIVLMAALRTNFRRRLA